MGIVDNLSYDCLIINGRDAYLGGEESIEEKKGTKNDSRSIKVMTYDVLLVKMGDVLEILEKFLRLL